MSAPDVATEVVAEVAEEVAEQATHVAQVSRGLSGRGFGLALGGFVVGVGLGGAVGYILATRKLETKYSQIATDEIAEMQEHFNAKLRAQENTAGKTDLAEIVRERGYGGEKPTAPPMAVSPPSGVVEAAADEDEEDEPIETEAIEEPESELERNVFAQHGDDTKSPDEWDWHKERSRRSPKRPYIIHVDEREEQQAYRDVSLSYYEDDDVLAHNDDENTIIDEEEREKLVGEANLDKFGHGSGDPDVVFVRNDELEIDIEINRSPNSYAEDVHGFEPEIRHSHRRTGRLEFDDD